MRLKIRKTDCPILNVLVCTKVSTSWNTERYKEKEELVLTVSELVRYK